MGRGGGKVAHPIEYLRAHCGAVFRQVRIGVKRVTWGQSKLISFAKSSKGRRPEELRRGKKTTPHRHYGGGVKVEDNKLLGDSPPEPEENFGSLKSPNKFTAKTNNIT